MYNCALQSKWKRYSYRTASENVTNILQRFWEKIQVNDASTDRSCSSWSVTEQCELFRRHLRRVVEPGDKALRQRIFGPTLKRGTAPGPSGTSVSRHSYMLLALNEPDHGYLTLCSRSGQPIDCFTWHLRSCLCGPPSISTQSDAGPKTSVNPDDSPIRQF